jgi:hypothetical protein
LSNNIPNALRPLEASPIDETEHRVAGDVVAAPA